MVPPETGRRVRLTISLYGSAALALALLLAALGVFRGELSATIAGSALLVYFAFSLVSLVVSAAFYARRSFRVSWTDEGEFLVTSAQGPFSEKELFSFIRHAFRRALTVPEVVIDFTTDPRDTGAKKASVAVPYREDAARRIRPRVPRGAFVSQHARFRLSDHASFLSLSWRVDSALSLDRLTVRPTPSPCALPELPPGATGVTTGKSTRSRSDELHETRQYLPGDDPRRVNWKVYAHSGELSVRQGELLPPPSFEYVLAFSEAFPPNAGTSERRRLQASFDALMSKVASIALDLLESHHVVTTVVFTENGTLEKRSFVRDEARAETALLAALAMPRLRASPADLSSVLASCAQRAEILFFTLPTGVPSGLSAYGDRLRAFVGPVSAQPVVSLGSIVVRTLFRNDSTPNGTTAAVFDRNAVERACLALFREGLHAEAL